MSDSSNTDTPASTTTRNTDVRVVVGVAVMFALLGGLLVAAAEDGSLDAVLAATLGLLGVTAAVVVFGAGAVRTAAELLRP